MILKTLLALQKYSFCNVVLHCFYYKTPPEKKIIEKYCNKVYFYKRSLNPLFFFSFSPFIVNTRFDKNLLKNLCFENAPILFEGTHCSCFAAHSRLKHLKRTIRWHNVEFQYYYKLAQNSSSWRRFFYSIESWKLKRYESNWNQKDDSFLSHFFFTKKDADVLNLKNSKVIRPFIGKFPKNNLIGCGKYALFHGKLSVEDNDKAVRLICQQWNCELPLIIAGLKPNKSLIEFCRNRKVEIISNPSELEMISLQKNAHIHILWTFQAEGIKLKLIKALLYGRHVVTNSLMVEGTNLAQLVTIVNQNEISKKVINLTNTPFLGYLKRKEQLDREYNDEKNVQEILKALF